MKRVAIFTKHSMQPRHPRIQMELDILREEGYEATVVANTQGIKGNQGGLIDKLRYYLSFTYFHWPLIRQYRRQLHQHDAVIIYDLALAPLIPEARAQGKHVVYETIDNNVTYTFHALAARLPILKALGPWVTRRMQRYEQRIARQHAHRAIVNSPALVDYIGGPGIILNLYASPFEAIQLDDSPGKPLAYLYLGEYTVDKGGPEMLDIAEKTGRPFLIYGFVKEQALKDRIAALPNVVQHDRMNVDLLLQHLQEQARHYRFAGFSLIRPVHLSFATQEANKDIDYLALGIPLVANDRGITKEKVDQGCGVMHHDQAAMERLATDEAYYRALSERSRAFYAQHYARANFRRGLLQALNAR